jgi:competence protein ComEC
MLPIVAVAFGSQSLVSPLANAVAVPLFTLVLVPLNLIGTFMASLWPAMGGVLLDLASHVLQWCWPLMVWLGHWSDAVWHFPQLDLWHLAALTVGAALIILPGIWATRLAGCALCIPAFVLPASHLKSGEFVVTMLDVGQGLAVVVRTSEHVIAYDAGPAFRSGRDTGELVVLPYLRGLGIRHLDLFIASHGDQDHVGGARTLLKGISTDAALLGPSVHGLPARSTECWAGQKWKWDDVDFETLAPLPALADRDNDSSCVVRITGVGGSALLTGDIEKTAEAALIANSVSLVADVVTMPHHGSKTSSTSEFVQAVNARYVLAGVGYRNRWGFPKREVVERWQSAGAITLATSMSGALQVDVLSDGVHKPHEYRQEHRRYWRARQPAKIRGK